MHRQLITGLCGTLLLCLYANWRCGDANVVEATFIREARLEFCAGSAAPVPKFFDDLRKELPFGGVYSRKDGRLRSGARELQVANGIVLSPDEKYLYASNLDPDAKSVGRHPLGRDGSLAQSVILIDLTHEIPGEEAA